MNGDDNDIRIKEIINNSIRYLEIYLNNLNDQKIPQSSKNMENNKKPNLKKNERNARNIKNKSHSTNKAVLQTSNKDNPINNNIKYFSA